ncbi:MAG: hypothetical protein GXX98_04970 [Planctomycetes bacterium]|nr:hypothetical protein [Planctomycetota bacterium]
MAICILNGLAMDAEVHGRTECESPSLPLTFVLTKLDVTDKVLEVSYQIRNDSDREAWLCQGLGSNVPRFSSEVAMSEDGETLLVRRRLDVPIAGFGEQVFGRFVRIPRGVSREETVFFALPVRPHRIILSARRRDETIKYVKQLRIEIGYYSGDLPATIAHMLEDAARAPEREHVDDMGYPTDTIGWFGDPLYFNRLNEIVPDRNEQVVVPWTDQMFEGEQLLQASIEHLHVPYVEDVGFVDFAVEGLKDCTRAEIHYRPSMLEYLFPHPIQQSVLTSADRQHLQMQKVLLLEDRISIGALIDEVGKANGWITCSGCAFGGRSTLAHVVCYQGHERITSFSIYGDMAVVTDEGHCYQSLPTLSSVRAITSAVDWVEPIRLRVECAANLSKLWYRLRLYRQIGRLAIEDTSPREQVAYPSSERWCDAMLCVFQIAEHTVKAYQCPGAGEGRCHYAMNSNCGADSPREMVLLFETKAGWNQHGGPELFTFDNHDAQGGCVLLNDGTVKFIRTEQELHTLHWK